MTLFNTQPDGNINMDLHWHIIKQSRHDQATNNIMRKTQSRVQENKNFAHKIGEYKSGSVALLLQMLKQHLIGFDCYSITFF